MIMMGHSFGGATTVNALREEPRLRFVSYYEVPFLLIFLLNTEAATGGVLQKRCFNNFSIFTEKHLRWKLFLTKSWTRVFMWNSEIFKNTYFEKHLQMAAFAKSNIKKFDWLAEIYGEFLSSKLTCFFVMSS